MWSTTVDPRAKTIQLDGFPLVVVIFSCVFLALSIVAVSLRTYIRLVKGTFGVDDGFMVTGTAVYMAVCGLALYGLLVGLGRLEKELNQWQWSEALKYYIIWILMYVIALAIIKSSVCITILRIATTKKSLCIATWGLLVITWCSFLVTFLGTLLYCRPVSAVWLPQLILSGNGTCAPIDSLVIIGHVATVSTIVTDLALVVVPGILLWGTQMKRQAKLQAWGLLSFASVASIITILRIPYINKFEGGVDLQFWVAHTVLCSNIETGIGCIASSIPSIRHLLRHNQEGSSSGPNIKRSGERGEFFTIGTDPRYRGGREGNRNATDIGISLYTVQGRADDNWQRLQDGDSNHSGTPVADPRGICADHPYSENVNTGSQV